MKLLKYRNVLLLLSTIQKSLIKRCLSILLFLSLLLPCVSRADENKNDIHRIDRIIVFGDSLSDNGNLFSLTKRLHKVTDKIAITPGDKRYWHGRFSNGPVWAEYLAKLIQFLPNITTTEGFQSKQFIDCAYGGAWAEKSPPVDKKAGASRHPRTPVPTLDTQVDNFILKHQRTITTHDLFFILIGANDYANKDVDHLPDPREPNQASDLVISAIRSNIMKLMQHGAKNFVLIGLPNLAKTPFITLHNTEKNKLTQKIRLVTKLHNRKLRQLVIDLELLNPSSHFIFFDAARSIDNSLNKSNRRKRGYSLIHQENSRELTPMCIIESGDPDYSKINSSTSPKVQKISTKQPAYFKRNSKIKYCDLHQPNDQKSSISVSAYAHTGRLFFDHCHPITYAHLKLALSICHLISKQGYLFYHSATKNLIKPNCKIAGLT